MVRFIPLTLRIAFFDASSELAPAVLWPTKWYHPCYRRGTFAVAKFTMLGWTNRFWEVYKGDIFAGCVKQSCVCFRWSGLEVFTVLMCLLFRMLSVFYYCSLQSYKVALKVPVCAAALWKNLSQICPLRNPCCCSTRRKLSTVGPVGGASAPCSHLSGVLCSRLTSD